MCVRGFLWVYCYISVKVKLCYRFIGLIGWFYWNCDSIIKYKILVSSGLLKLNCVIKYCNFLIYLVCVLLIELLVNNVELVFKGIFNYYDLRMYI